MIAEIVLSTIWRISTNPLSSVVPLMRVRPTPITNESTNAVITPNTGVISMVK